MSGVERVNALTEAQREAALDSARRHVAGREPATADFAHLADSRYPPWVLNTIRALTIAMLIAAFLPSAMRLHQTGLDAFRPAFADSASTYAAALAIVLMAEIGQVIFSLATITSASRWQRGALYFGAGVCTLIALSGNYAANAENAFDSLFTFLDTFAPPVLVLITAQVLKSQMLHSVSERHRARVEYARAHASWQTAYDNAHLHARWMHSAANALRDALRSANKVSKAILREVTDEEWRVLILRELSAENWYERTEQARAEVQAARASGGGNHTGELAGAVVQREDGVYVATCPSCQRTFDKSTEVAAMKAVVAHLRACEARNGATSEPA